MKNPLKLILFNVLVGILILIILYVHAFDSGFGAGANHLKQEERFFVGAIVVHLVINLFFIYRYIKINWINALMSTLFIIIFYLIEAWRFGYFL